MLSLLWTGIEIKDQNINAIKEFRKKFPDAQLIHFIDPLNFLISSSSAKLARKKISSVVKPEDDTALLVYASKNLVKGAGVLFRSQPNFFGQEEKLNCAHLCGHQVPINSYSEEELYRIITHGNKVLIENGFDPEQKIMAGGWLASSTFLSAAIKAKFKVDFSAVPPALLKRRLGYYPLYHWVKGLWGEYVKLSQPFLLKAQSGSILEVGQNTATIDYSSLSELTAMYDSLKTASKAENVKKIMHLGIYQETALKQIPKLDAFVNHVQQTNMIGFGTAFKVIGYQ